MKTTITEKANAAKPLAAKMEDEMTHTPGPWSISGILGDNHIMAPPIFGRGRTTVAIAVGWHGLDPAELEANKRLIASAPALLEALKGMQKRLRDSYADYRNDWTETDSNIYEQASKAIAQAEGGRQ